MRKTLLALVITSVSINAFGFYREKCSLVECHNLSRQEIADIQKEGIAERFMGDEDTVVDLRKIYDNNNQNGDFPTWFNNEFKSRVEQFSKNLSSNLKIISDIEKQFGTTIPNDARIASTQDHRDLIQLNDSNACLIGEKKGLRKKNCNGKLTPCEYSREWKVVVKTEVSNRETIQPYSFLIKGHNAMIGGSRKTKNNFKNEDDRVSKIITEMPKCR